MTSRAAGHLLELARRRARCAPSSSTPWTARGIDAPLGGLGRPGRRLGRRRPGRRPLHLGLRPRGRGVPRPGRRAVEPRPLLNGADVFAWNADKALPGRASAPLPVVPTSHAATVDELARRGRPVRHRGRQAAGRRRRRRRDRGRRPGRPAPGHRIQSHPELPPSPGPWVVQPLVESVRTEGETSVFVLDGTPGLARSTSCPAGEEIRVHEQFGGASRPVELTRRARRPRAERRSPRSRPARRRRSSTGAST